ncbi:uncharacterized protein LOC144261109 [Eretmochelys imbricata]
MSTSRDEHCRMNIIGSLEKERVERRKAQESQQEKEGDAPRHNEASQLLLEQAVVLHQHPRPKEDTRCHLKITYQQEQILLDTINGMRNLNTKLKLHSYRLLYTGKDPALMENWGLQRQRALYNIKL